MYMQSMFVNHEYWMLPAATEATNADFDVPLLELCDILMLTLGAPPQLPGAPRTAATPEGCRQLLPGVQPRTNGVGATYRLPGTLGASMASVMQSLERFQTWQPPAGGVPPPEALQRTQMNQP